MSSPEPRFEELSLANLDSLGDSGELRERVRAMVPPGAAARPNTPHEGADATDSVWVSVDGRGLVEGVEISRHWPERLGPGDVAGALFESYLDATRKAFDAAALRAFREQEQEQQAGDDRDTDHGRASGDRREAPVSAPGTEGGEREWLAATWDTLESIGAELRRIDGARDAARGQEATVTSPYGYLTLRVQGRAIVGVTGDARLIGTASAEGLRRDALAVFRTAQRADD